MSTFTPLSLRVKFMDDVTISSVLSCAHWFTIVFNSFYVCKLNRIVILFTLLYHSSFQSDQMTFVFNSYSVKRNIFWCFLALYIGANKWYFESAYSLFRLMEILQVFDSRYHFQICFTPRDMFKHIVIIKLRILVLRSSHPLCGLYFFYVISIAITHPGVTCRRGGFSPLNPAETRTVRFCSSVLFVYPFFK